MHFEREDWWEPRHHHIDPFTVIGAMNRRTTDANRTVLAKVLSLMFDIKISPPTQFEGIPVLNNRNSFFNGVDEVWNLFLLAVKAAETNEFTEEFKVAFERAIAVSGNGLTYITMGLYWIRPNIFMPLDGNSRAYVSTKYRITPPSDNCTGNEYVDFLETLKSKVAERTPGITFPEISYSAWTDKKILAPENSGANTKAVVVGAPIAQTSGNKIPKNLILFGTPGTGKTYSSMQYAFSIIEGFLWFTALSDAERVK